MVSLSASSDERLLPSRRASAIACLGRLESELLQDRLSFFAQDEPRELPRRQRVRDVAATIPSACTIGS